MPRHRVSGHLGLPILLLTLLLSVVLPAKAQQPLEAVDFLPHDLDRDSAAKQLSRLAGRPVTLAPQPQSLVELLRWSSRPDRSQLCLAQAQSLRETISWHPNVTPPSLRSDVLPALVAQALQQQLELEREQALDALERALAWLPCAPEPVSKNQLWNLYFQQAELRVYVGDARQTESIRNMLAVDPARGLPERTKPRVLAAVDQGRADVAGLAVYVLDPSTVPTGLLLDGEPYNAGTPVRPGTHLLQLQDPLERFSGVLWEIPSQPTASVPTGTMLPVPSTFFGPDQTPEQASSALLANLSRGHLDASQVQALRLGLAGLKVDTLLFALKPDAERPPVLLELGLPSLEPRVLVAEPAPRSATNVALGVGLSALGLARVGDDVLSLYERSGGLAFRLSAPLPRWSVDLMVSVHRMVPPEAYSGLSHNPLLLAGVAFGPRVPLGPHLELSLPVRPEVGFAPQAIFHAEVDGAVTFASSRFTLGGSLCPRVTYLRSLGKAQLMLDLELAARGLTAWEDKAYLGMSTVQLPQPVLATSWSLGTTVELGARF